MAAASCAVMPGSTSCPCVLSLEAMGIASATVVLPWTANAQHSLSTSYGVAGCDIHDLHEHPECIGAATASEVSVVIPSWCLNQWCYVNGSSCLLDSAVTSYEWLNTSNVSSSAAGRLDELQYSYSTCGDTDTYELWLRGHESHTSAGTSQFDVAVVAVTIALVLIALVLCCLLRHHLSQRRHFKMHQAQLERNQLHYVVTGTHAVPVPLGSSRYHLFLSHSWVSAQDRMRLIKERLSTVLPELVVFLDVDGWCCPLPRCMLVVSPSWGPASRAPPCSHARLRPRLRTDLSEGRGAVDVAASQRVISYCSDDYFASKNCMRELLWAVCLRKPVTVLRAAKKGGRGYTLEGARRQLQESYANFEGWGLIEELEAWLDPKKRSEREALLGDEGAAEGLQVPSLDDIDSALFGTGAEPSEPLEWSHVRLFQNAMVQKMAEPFVRPCEARRPPRFKGNVSGGPQSPARSPERGPGGSPRFPIPAQEQPLGADERRTGRETSGSEHQDRVSKALSNNPYTLKDLTAVYMFSDITCTPTVLPPPLCNRDFHVFCSPFNPGAKELLEELAEARQLSSLKVTYDAMRQTRAEQMLLYLRKDTWSGKHAQHLQEQTLLAMRLKVPLLLAHEDVGADDDARNAEEFERIISATPPQLLRNGVYTKIAVPIKGGYLRQLSLAMLGNVLASTKVRGDLWSLSVRELTFQTSKKEGQAFDGKQESLERDTAVWDRIGEGLTPYMSQVRADTLAGTAAPLTKSLHVSGMLSMDLRRLTIIKAERNPLAPSSTEGLEGRSGSVTSDDGTAPVPDQPLAPRRTWRGQRKSNWPAACTHADVRTGDAVDVGVSASCTSSSISTDADIV